MDGLDWCASAMKIAQARLEVAADNLSNAHADGFRKRLLSVVAGRDGLRARSVADSAAPPLRATGHPLDLTVVAGGGFAVRAASGATEIVSGGAFRRGPDGLLVDAAGRALLGRSGAVRVPDERVTIDAAGNVQWNGTAVDRLAVSADTRVASGFLRASSVDAVREMVAILDAQRTFETASKALTAIDAARNKAINDAGQVKG